MTFPDTRAIAELAELVTVRERQEGDVSNLEHRIDAIVYLTYGITEEEQEAIVDLADAIRVVCRTRQRDTGSRTERIRVTVQRRSRKAVRARR